MIRRLWAATFDEAIVKANRYFYARQYRDAAVEFEAAARVAPATCVETAALEMAFVAIQLAENAPEAR